MPQDLRSAQRTLPKWHSDDGNIARNGSYLLPSVKAAASCWSYVCSGWRRPGLALLGPAKVYPKLRGAAWPHRRLARNPARSSLTI
eukprot:118774-Pleurochrysis_carterae.AAC.1